MVFDIDLLLIIGLIYIDYFLLVSFVDSLFVLESDYDSVKFVVISMFYVDGGKGLFVMWEGIINVFV